MITAAALARVLRCAAAELDAIASEDAGRFADWVDQASSPLGSRRHITAARRRMAAGLDGAGQAGRRFYLSPQAVAQELGHAAPAPADEHDDDAVAALRGRLALVRGAVR